MAEPTNDAGAESVLVLYVDDERSNRVVFEHALGSMFSVITRASAEEALAVLEQRDVGVLVTDQRMLGMSGNELLQQAKLRWPDVVRIVITAYSDIEPILAAINAGLVARYIVKPWERDELIALLRWACEVYGLGQRDKAVMARLLQVERLALVGSLTGSAVHDIAMPLSALLGNAESLLQRSKAAPALSELFAAHGHGLARHERSRARALIEDLPGLAHDIHETADVAGRLVRNVSRLTHGARGDELPIADPISVTQHAVSVGQRELPLGASARYVGPRPLPEVKIPPSDLFRVLLNLLLNAAQALSRGEQGGRIEIDARIERATVTLMVRDDGPGMSAEVLKKATQEYFTTRSDGSGLGLAQCRRLVEQAGGELLLQSSEGHGTTITVTLPRHSVVTEPPAEREVG